MNGFALADCLIVLDEEATTIEKGQMVEVHLVNPI
jgi:molybdopterin biosynthesis enzyme